MVATKPTPQAAKRKKTADMPESPPKRVTRARAKATTDLGTKPKITKITTASAKVSAENKQAVEPPKPAKRKTRADDEQDKPLQQSITEQQPTIKSTKSGSKVKKSEETVVAAEEYLKPAETVPRTRRRPPKSAPVGEAKAEASKPRGRGRRPAKTLESIPASVNEPVLKEETVKRTTRGRPTSAAVNATSIKQLAAGKKRVKFQVEPGNDKENLLIETGISKPADAVTGIKARPVRKPAAARVTTRTRKAGDTTSNAKGDAHDSSIHPLSPKKIKQVAKSSSISSEDELCGGKTPMRSLSLSPVKPPVSSNHGIFQNVSKLDLQSITEPVSPTQNVSTTVLASPARRPPPSPFKDALKDSPKKGNLGDTMMRLTPKSRQSPVRVLFGESARRGNLGDALSHRPLLYSQSPTKSSLFKSPARRLVGSPMKLAAPRTPGKSGPSIPVIDAVTASKQVNTFELPDPSAQAATSSPLRASRSPEQPVKVHKLTAAEQGADIDQGNSAPTPITFPVQGNQVGKASPISILTRDRETFEHDAHTPKAPSSITVNVCDEPSVSCDNLDCTGSEEKPAADSGDALSTTPPGPPSILSVSVLDPSLSMLRHTPEDSDSEDELASPERAYEPTPLRNFGVSTRDFGTPTTVSVETETRKSSSNGDQVQGNLNASLTPRAPLDSVSITPLALQLSSWLASSPEKKTPSNHNGQGCRFLSPRGAAIFDKPEHELMESPQKTSFFEDQMAMHDSLSPGSPHSTIDPQECMDGHASQDSQASDEYGDENAVPIDPLLLDVRERVEDQTLTCTPARVFCEQPRETHTVSKVPLRPAGDDSPRKVPRKRSKSLAGHLAVVETPDKPIVGHSRTVVSKAQGLMNFESTKQGPSPVMSFKTPFEASIENPQTPKTGGFSIAGTPLGINTVPDVLKGAVVYVDVHTTEGADASGIFVELLTQMGARCVKQWLWNPRASTAGNPEAGNEVSDCSTPGSKIGITHVVYKDGGKRTLEKVHESKGAVVCVGVGWVLE